MIKLSITIDDTHAEAAFAAEIARIAQAGTTMTPDEYAADFLTTQHVNMREGQLIQAAQAKAEQDPELVAFRSEKQANAAADAEAVNLDAQASFKERA